MSAGRTLIGNQSRLAGDRSDGHHVFHGRSAFCTGRSANVRFMAPLFIDSVFIRHGTRPFRQGCRNVFVSLKVTVYPRIGFSARHSESEDRRCRFAQPLAQDVLHFGERGWLVTASVAQSGAVGQDHARLTGRAECRLFPQRALVPTPASDTCRSSPKDPIPIPKRRSSRARPAPATPTSICSDRRRNIRSRPTVPIRRATPCPRRSSRCRTSSA
jgi:hypothetical protein